MATAPLETPTGNNAPPTGHGSQPPAPGDALAQAKAAVIRCWGDMASHWGVSRGMAQVYALLYVSEQPQDTEAIMEQLGISRGNANMNLHKLQDWGLIEQVPVADTRRAHFRAEKDVWTLTAQLMRERAKREVEPVYATLLQVLAQLENEPQKANPANPEADADADAKAQTRLADNIRQMLVFLELVHGLAEALGPLLEGGQHGQLINLLKPLLASNGLGQQPPINPDPNPGT